MTSLSLSREDQQPQPLFNEILAGGRKLKVFTSLVLSALVTAAVAAPMAISARAYEAPAAEDVVATADQILVNTPDEDAMPLGDRTINGNVLIGMDHDNAAAVSFALAPEGGENLEVRTDGVGPRFDFYTDEQGRATWLDTRQIPDGRYEMRVTVRTQSDDIQKTLTSFEIANGGES